MSDVEDQFDIIEFLRALEELYKQDPKVTGKFVDWQVREIWKKWLASGKIQKLTGNKTFFGLTIKEGKGFRIGKNIEVTFDTPVPGIKRSGNVDILITERTVDETGRITGVKVTGMDHHPRGPSDPLANNGNRLHFEKKERVMQNWDQYLRNELRQKNPNIEVRTNFEEKNSYFWKRRAETLQRLRRTGDKGVFGKYVKEVSTVGRILRTSLALGSIGAKGAEIMDFELKLYQSSTLRRLMEYINKGKTSQAEYLLRQIRDDPEGMANDDIFDLFLKFVQIVGIQSAAIKLWELFIQYLYDTWKKNVEPVGPPEAEEDGDSSAQEQPLPAAEPPKQAPAPVTPKVPEHPHTVSPPVAFEEELRLEHVKSEAEFIRKLIKTIRAQIRKYMKWLNEAESWEVKYKELLREAIEKYMRELERLREKINALGVGTDEEWDEPLEPVGPPPFPPWPLGHNWLHPYILYVNPKTGEQRWGGDKPPGEGWEPMYDPKTGGGLEPMKPRFRWGWVLRIDPDTLKPHWEKGWIPIEEETETSYLGPQYEQRISSGTFLMEMKKAQRRGIDIFKIANRNGINLFRPATQSEMGLYAGMFEVAANEAIEAQIKQRGTIGWGRFLPMFDAERMEHRRAEKNNLDVNRGNSGAEGADNPGSNENHSRRPS